MHKSESRYIVSVCLGKHSGNKKTQRFGAGAEVELHYIKGNSCPYFSVTGFVRGACGCCHEELLKLWPELKPVVDLHLSDDEGMPLYAVENGYFHVREGHTDTLAKHLRIPLADAEDIITRYALQPFSKEYFAQEFVEPNRLRYLKEAIKAIRLIREWGQSHPNRIDQYSYRMSLDKAL